MPSSSRILYLLHIIDDLFRSGVGAPIINECDGEHHYDNQKRTLQWNLPFIDASNKTGSLEFTINGQPDDFFPVTVTFVSKQSFCDIKVGHFFWSCLDQVVSFVEVRITGLYFIQLVKSVWIVGQDCGIMFP